jgi:ribosome-associated heat shock protein Hsp15
MEDQEQPQERESEGGVPRARLDKWLWAAHFFKARALATQAIESGRVRVNGERVKPTCDVQVGDRVAVQGGEFEWEVDILHLVTERGAMLEGEDLYDETDDSRDRRALLIANRSAHHAPQGPAWARPAQSRGEPGNRSRGGPRRAPPGGQGGASRNRGATAAFLNPETSPSQLVAAVTGGAPAGRSAPGGAPAAVRDADRKPRRRRRGRGVRVRGASPGGEGGGGNRQQG